MTKEKGITRYKAPEGMRGGTQGGEVTLFQIKEMHDSDVDKYGLRKYKPKEQSENE